MIEHRLVWSCHTGDRHRAGAYIPRQSPGQRWPVTLYRLLDNSRMPPLPVVVTLPAPAVAKYCNERVCLCVCLFAKKYPERHARSLPSFCACYLYGRGSVLLRQGDEIPRETWQFWGVFFPTDNALYSIGREVGGACTPRAKSDIYYCLVCCWWYFETPRANEHENANK